MKNEAKKCLLQGAKKSILVGALVVGLTGCLETTPEVIDLAPSCGASSLRGLVGQDGAILQEIEISAPLRVYKPGMAATLDYRPDRLNVSLDERGIITRVWCS